MEYALAPVACRSILVIGAARSGKSRYALALAEATAPERIHLAAAEAGDAEMAERIARLRRGHGEGWRTREEPLELAAALRVDAGPDARRRSIARPCGSATSCLWAMILRRKSLN